MLLDYLPPSWRHRAIESGLARAIDVPLLYWRGLIATRARYLDPEATPEDWLDWLMFVVALPRNDALDARRKRGLIAVAHRVWAAKGTVQSIQMWVQAIAGSTAQVRNLNASAWVIGLSTLGNTLGPGVLAWRFEVAIDPNAISPAELRTLLTPVAPACCVYRIVDLSGGVLSDFS